MPKRKYSLPALLTLIFCLFASGTMHAQEVVDDASVTSSSDEKTPKTGLNYSQLAAMPRSSLLKIYSNLDKANQSLTAQAAEAKALAEAAEAKLKELEKGADAAKAALQKSEKERVALQDRVSKQSEMLKGLEATILANQKEIKGLAELSKMPPLDSDAVAKSKALEEELKEITASNQKADELNGELKSLNDELQSELKDKEAALSEALSKNDALAANLNAASDAPSPEVDLMPWYGAIAICVVIIITLVARQNSFSRIKHQLVVSEKAQRGFDDKLKAKDSEIAQIQQGQKAIEDKAAEAIERSKELVDEKEMELDALNAQLKTVETQLSQSGTLQQQLEQAQADLKAQFATVEANDKEMEKLNQQVLDLNSQLKVSTELQQQLKQDLKAQAEQQQSSADSAPSDNSSKELEEVRIKLSESEQNTMWLEDQLDEAKEEIEELTKQVESSGGGKGNKGSPGKADEEDASKVEELVHALEEAEGEVESHQVTIGKLNEELENIRKENEEILNKLKA